MESARMGRVDGRLWVICEFVYTLGLGRGQDVR